MVSMPSPSLSRPGARTCTWRCSCSPGCSCYTLGHAAMNHRAFFVEKYGSGQAVYEKDREFGYDAAVPKISSCGRFRARFWPRQGSTGAHGVTRRKDGAIVITRNDVVTPRRLTYTPSTQTVLVEKMPHRANAFLERFHRRAGYATAMRSTPFGRYRSIWSSWRW